MFTTATLYSIIDVLKSMIEEMEPVVDTLNDAKFPSVPLDAEIPAAMPPSGIKIQLDAESPFTSGQLAIPPMSGIEVDETGLPYDARIHTSGKDKKMKGRNIWKKRRGVNASLVEQVEAELRAALAVSDVPTPVPVATPTPVPTPAPTPTPAPVATSAPAPNLGVFAQLVTDVANKPVPNSITQPVLLKYGFADFLELNNSQACDTLIPIIRTELGL